MHGINVKRIDFNLLLLFNAIASTRSVTKAAKQLALSQPAASHALKRLRELVGDPLFIRSKDGLLLTARAESLAAQIHEILNRVDSLFKTDEFDALTTTQRFRVGASDYSMIVIMPCILNELRRLAPFASLDIIQVNTNLLTDIEAGKIDCSFWGAGPITEPFISHKLFEDRHIGLICENHPLANKIKSNTLSLDDYCAFPHVVTAMGKAIPSAIDLHLETLRRSRRIAVTTPNFSANLASLVGTDLIMSAPNRIANQLNQHKLLSFELPMAMPPIDYSLIWHERTSTDSCQIWLRNLISCVTAKIQ